MIRNQPPRTEFKAAQTMRSWDIEINEHLCGSIGKLKVAILQIPANPTTNHREASYPKLGFDLKTYGGHAGE
jgi:hypothetical protein